jgi:hypothetical protein
MSTVALAPPTALAEGLRETIFAQALADLQSEVQAQQVMQFPAVMSRHVPPPDVRDLDLCRKRPDGAFEIVVHQGRAIVALTVQRGISEQQSSIPVGNAAVLGDVAAYVVLAVGGDLKAGRGYYAAPEWLARQVVLPLSHGERERLRLAASLANLTDQEGEDLLSAQVAGTVYVVAGATPEAYCVRSADGATCSLSAWAAARSEPDVILVSSDASNWRACFASQRAEADRCVGVAPTVPKAIHALVISAGVGERFGIAADGDAYDTYELFINRRLIEYTPLHGVLVNMRNAWNGEHAR